MLCTTCHQPIDPERLEVLPDTTTCTLHSTYIAPLALMDYAHKTAGCVVLIERNGPGGAERERIARRAYRRAR